MKVYELAKKLNMNSKDIISIATNLGIEVKTHMSSLTDVDVNKIEKNLKKKKEKEKIKAKNDNPVIVRRVISNEDIVSEDNNKETKSKERKDVGFVERNHNKDFKIVYRNKQQKPPTVSELFGLDKPKKEIKKEIKKETKKEEKVVEKNNKENKVVETNKENIASKEKETKKIEDSKIKTEENVNKEIIKNNVEKIEKKGAKNTDISDTAKKMEVKQDMKENRAEKQDKKINNRNNNNRKNSYNNKNFDRKNNNNRNKKYDRNDNGNNNYKNNKKVLDEKEIDKTIKNIIEIETVAEKEPARDYSKSIDKKKSNRINNSRYDESKGNNRSRKSKGNEKFDEDKLKSLKQESRLSSMFNDQDGGMLDYYDLTTTRGKRNKKKNNNNQSNNENRVKQKIFKLTDITIPETITVKNLAAEMKKTTAEVIKKLLDYGVLATINNDIDFDTATLIAEEFGITTHLKETITEEDILFDDSEDSAEELEPRPPVVVVMGHVDHGKTSLLDAIRSTNVIRGEAGGITQHIGAYKVKVNDREITFLDTPGHEAFTSMRARGAQVTDIAILVVAANDGVMPQTVEAINHAKAAGIPIIVAVNKIDLPGANVERVKEQLTKYELVPEEWGGDTIYVPISAKEHTNIDTLLEMVLLVADMKELKANPNKQAKGVVIEAKLDKTKGPIATMLVQRGTLDVGDTIVVGSVIGRIRAMINDKGKKVKKAGPSTPVEVTGLTEVPSAGDTFYEVEDEKTAKHLIEKRKRQEREKSINATAKVSLNDLFSQIEKGKLKQLNIIVKADVQGSVEAVKQALEKLSNDEIQVKVIHANVGGITESDVTLAQVSNAIIIGFNVRPEPIARDMATKDGVEIKLYSVIYQAIEDIQMAMVGMLDPEYEEKVIGTAVVRQTFKVSSVGTIAGCYVTDGKIQRNAGVRVIRDNVVIHEGKLISLKRFKDDVKEVAKGFECGLQIENFNDIKEEDTIEVYVMEEIKRKLKDLKKTKINEKKD